MPSRPVASDYLDPVGAEASGALADHELVAVRVLELDEVKTMPTWRRIGESGIRRTLASGLAQ
jgi:hypothetical protein